MKNWTKEQLQAITAESGTILVSAAAGSGKTSVLVERIVRKLTDPEKPVAPSALLVVTFTNAAAAEMRSRIAQRLGELQAERALHKNLHGLMARLDEMSVCTMDAFCMRLVRENFSACDIEPDFGMIEEGEERALKAQIARKITDDIYHAPEEKYRALTRLFQVGRDDTALYDGILALSDFSMSEDFPEQWLDSLASEFVASPAESSVWGKVLLRYFADGVGYCISLCEAAMEELAQDPVLEEKLEGITIDDYAEQIVTAYKDNEGYEVSQEDAELDGSKGIEITINFPMGDSRMTIKQLVTEKNGAVIAVSYGAVDDVYEKMQKQFDKVIGGIKLK